MTEPLVQGSGTAGRRWKLTRSHPMTTSLDGPRLTLGGSVEVVDLAELREVLREAAELLEDVGTTEYVNPPTVEAMQRAARELRAFDGG